MSVTIRIDSGDPNRPPVVVDGDDYSAMTIEIDDPIPPATPPLRLGFHPTPAEHAKWYAALPTPWFSRVFIEPGKGLPPWGAAAAKAASTMPAMTIRHWSFKDQAPSSTVRAHLDSMPAGVHEWLTWQHEGDIDWKDDVAGYVRYWKWLRQVVDDHPARDRITLVNVHTGYASRFKRREMDWRWFMLPGIADVDAWDCYRPSTPDAYEAVESVLGLPAAAKREFGTRTHITELGAHPTSWDADGTQQARWYREACEFAAAEGFEAVGFFCNADGKLEYRPTKPAVLAAWRELLAKYNGVAA